jgi:minor extracellular serine protease Vpr
MSITRSVALLVAASACLALACGSDAAWGQNAAHRFQPYAGTASVDTSRLGIQRSGETVKVVVVMSEDSIATARAKSATRTISLSERASIEQRVDAQHESIRREIEARGGKVLAKFHSALNGIKVDIHPSQIGALEALPGVVRVLPVGRYQPNNIVSVPFIGAPAVWSGTPAFRGEHIKIAIIDTGIDYTHANFGGPGTPAAFAAAQAAGTQPADPAQFGRDAPKVKGGFDFVGDAYTGATSGPGSVPMPDPNPLDCNGHGSHVAGTAAGFGVTAGGATYAGPYDSSIYANPQNFTIGPGVAPLADLYALRVFGCTGGSFVVTEGIDWAVQHDMDVISMSLGADTGPADTSSALAATNAARAGILVVASAGNAGPAPYMLGDPASADGAIAVAATDAHASFPGAAITLSPGTPIVAQDSNGAPLPAAALPVVVLPDTTGTGSNGISRGCNPAEYTAAGVTGKLVVVVRGGTCARVARAVYGEQAGAAAVAMINNAPGYPPFEGKITSNPDTGQAFTVTIPFLGVLTSDEVDLKGAGGGSAMLAATQVADTGFRLAASFSSGGPREGDSVLRPGTTAPGVSLSSTLVGSGNGATIISGTSQAAPHVSAVSALVREAHPSWGEREQAAAVVETSDPAQLTDYAGSGPRLEGAGLVQPVGATRTHAVALSEEHPLDAALSFGFAEFTRDFRASQELRVVSEGSDPITFNVSATATSGAPHTITLSPSTITVGRDGEGALLRVTLTVPAATVGSTHDAQLNDLFQQVAGFLTLTPADSSMNNGVTLHVPYFLVPRARSAVRASASGELSAHHPQGLVRLSNKGGAIAGNGDFYEWGLSGTRQGVRFFDVRAVGVQSNVVGSDSLLVFAVNTFDRFSQPSQGEFDILLDTDGDGVPDYDVFAVDQGIVTGTGHFNGQMVVGVANLKTHRASLTKFLADAPTDGSTVLIPVFASSLGLSPSSSAFTYQVFFFNNFFGTAGRVPGAGSFDVFHPAISNAMFAPVAPGTTVSVPFQVDPAQLRKTPALGLMVVTEDNHAGGSQASLLPVRLDD